jgi:hypothetical protein
MSTGQDRRDTAIKRLIDDITVTISAPDFWPMLGLFVGFLAAFGLFFWLAVGFDMMSSIYGRWQGACRKLGDWQAFILFVSPFAIGISSMLAAGELISQLERKNRFGRPMKWKNIWLSFGFAMALLTIISALMLIWC